MLSKAARKYFEKYAVESLQDDTRSKWDRAVVIPARREGENLLRAIASIKVASEHIRCRSLIVIVLNGTKEEQASLDTLTEKLSTHADLKIIRLSRAGVGYARKAGMDFTARLFFSGQLKSPWLRTTDADVEVPLNYLIDSDDITSGAFIYSFVHRHDDLQGQEALAHCIYDIFLRYYVAGLKHSESPYAFQCLGSTLCIHAESYVAVRGFSDLDAGEDFYIVNKIAKVSSIHSLSSAPIHIGGRLSDRVPFGTGAGSTKYAALLKEGKPPEFYDPKSFDLLREWLQLLNKYSQTLDTAPFFEASNPLKTFFEDQRLLDELSRLPIQSPNPSTRHKQVMHWFDGFRTLKLIHYIRDAFLPALPWDEALRNTTFLALRGAIGPETAFDLDRQLSQP